MQTLNVAKGDTVNAVINYLNETTVTINGDIEIVKQIVEQLNNQTINSIGPSIQLSEN